MSIRIIGAAIGHGAMNPSAQDAPERLRVMGLAGALGDGAKAERFWEASWDTTIYPHFTRRRQKDLPIVEEFSERLQKVVYRVMVDGDFPLVVGGDHSCAIGTWTGVARAWRDAGGEGGVGLVWIDAHLDSHTFDTSPSAALHGMPLAALLGHGQRRIVSCGGMGAKVDPSRCAVIGARSWEEGEEELLNRLGVRIITSKDARERGIGSCLSEAVGIARGTGGFWGVSLDMDAIDPAQAPGVGSSEPDGLDANGLVQALSSMDLGADGDFRAFELTELAPALDDKEGSTAALAMRLAKAALC